MIELTGRLKSDVSFNAYGQPQITFVVNERSDALKMVDEHRDDEKLTIKVEKFREKRSLNANNYAWHLINEIANVTRQSKDDIYLKLLKRYGQSAMVSVEADIPALDFFKYGEEIGEGTVKGKLFKHYRVYKGSSEYNTLEMSIFIDGVVSEADDLGIQTMTPNELAKMKSLWGE